MIGRSFSSLDLSPHADKATEALAHVGRSQPLAGLDARGTRRCAPLCAGAHRRAVPYGVAVGTRSGSRGVKGRCRRDAGGGSRRVELDPDAGREYEVRHTARGPRAIATEAYRTPPPSSRIVLLSFVDAQLRLSNTAPAATEARARARGLSCRRAVCLSRGMGAYARWRRRRCRRFRHRRPRQPRGCQRPVCVDALCPCAPARIRAISGARERRAKPRVSVPRESGVLGHRLARPRRSAPDAPRRSRRRERCEARRDAHALSCDASGSRALPLAAAGPLVFLGRSGAENRAALECRASVLKQEAWEREGSARVGVQCGAGRGLLILSRILCAFPLSLNLTAS